MKVQLPQGVASISGTISRSANHRLIAKTFTKMDGTQETRFYLMRKHERSTPASDKEIAQRERLVRANRALSNLTHEQKEQFIKEGKRTNFCFNGKQYNTFRGYMMARLLGEQL